MFNCAYTNNPVEKEKKTVSVNSVSPADEGKEIMIHVGDPPPPPTAAIKKFFGVPVKRVYILAGVLMVFTGTASTIAIVQSRNSISAVESNDIPETCDAPADLIPNFKNGICDEGVLNSLECDWDGGDCVTAEPSLNPTASPSLQYITQPSNFPSNEPSLECIVDDPSKLGNGICDNDTMFNTERCSWDGLDCEQRNNQLIAKYPDCFWIEISQLGDGICHGSLNNVDCGYDDGDCNEFNLKYPNCGTDSSNNGDMYYYYEINPQSVGNGICDDEQNTKDCGWDGSDCIDVDSIITLFPNCLNLWDRIGEVGDDYCDEGANIAQCGFDGGDCLLEPELNCEVDRPNWVGTFVNKYIYASCVLVCIIPDADSIMILFLLWKGDGYCDDWPYNSKACKFDGGDCTSQNNALKNKYPNCLWDDVGMIGDEICHNAINNEACGFDDGDCTMINRYTNCNFIEASWVGDSICEGTHNNKGACK
jgi:hypothetical protein